MITVSRVLIVYALVNTEVNSCAESGTMGRGQSVVVVGGDSCSLVAFQGSLQTDLMLSIYLQISRVNSLRDVLPDFSCKQSPRCFTRFLV